MRKILIALAVVLLAASPALAWGPTFIGGAGVGIAVTGPDDGRTFVTQYAGAKVGDFNTAALYACYQHASIDGVADVGGDGARLIFAASLKKATCLSTLFGIGFLDDLQPDGTGGYKTGLTADGGLSYDASEWMEVSVYGSAWDRGDATSWSVMLGLTLKDPQRIIPGWGGK